MTSYRFYRNQIKMEDLTYFEVKLAQTDLQIGAKRNLAQEAMESVKKYRKQLEDYIARDKYFMETFKPYKVAETAPVIVRHMAEAGKIAKVGPMAAVAGAISQYVGKDLIKISQEIIIENGGDIYMDIKKTRDIGIYAGDSPLSGKLALKIYPDMTPCGICTSAGTIGHSASFGQADAVTVYSSDTLLADAAATSIGNVIKSKDDIKVGIEKAKEIPGLKGIMIIVGSNIGLWGELELIK